MHSFKSFIVVVIILLFTQQSIAAYAPMKCDNMKSVTVATTDKSSHSTSQMAMHEHGSMLKDKISSHKKCNACNFNGCMCGDMGSCFGSTISTSTQAITQIYTLFLDHGNKYLHQEAYTDSGVYMHLFRPPIHN
ncbi:hypothetical protein [Colwellia hornerae]|uniref:DUF2946 domain-containing protein n=1 Tax=Colwellia hornerae TaxID=89402 RepID=A0A5C6QMZ2_9GAMM|nr:hypothetical protein [Colwellia hornerae]TWX54641.1 hypothetical protein ESZ28_07995 [Colwellia hornerae]TWX61081.1 hypothetical protein ESZ26_06770 [Colwellia hornerae]TWX70334.1 hypothetical protein ESZ27_04260 [Colwellia hornerae]